MHGRIVRSAFGVYPAGNSSATYYTVTTQMSADGARGSLVWTHWANTII